MSKIEKFEDLEVWKIAIELAVKIYNLSNSGKLNGDFGIKDQIRRAAASISNNIAEGFEYNNNRIFCRYLSISKGSCGELRNQIYLLKEIEYIQNEVFEEINNEVLDLSRKISAFIKYLRKNLESQSIATKLNKHDFITF